MYEEEIPGRTRSQNNSSSLAAHIFRLPAEVVGTEILATDSTLGGANHSFYNGASLGEDK